ncbi:3-hydroxybutyryl-CoA dehydrogenase [Keratinibaculum paraultunense]|uniref:L-gulonate 3-dehydrogenase n=1 Tax=Keratinibaculum paraultunense TaxID=1278232 RepID=A0A4R3KYI3_9FIRM|nr:3-hydroxyacyl-CoA dehydrogenase family protein [Keratinibaculum paraultunense]QQY80776.1 3-hydroxyacyl-CoA dehydrogenase family protein [Keratinibaculum paraultunense]TCS89612.1 3-hydroxybutyryl-CoA dehydrogenase [Keratinibaculum paraultunense]
MNIKNVAVLGTGTIGHGIAQLCAQKGYNVNMFGRSDASLDRGFNSIKNNLEDLVNEKVIDENEAKEIVSRIKGFKTIKENIQDADIVIEAIAEDINIKQKVYKEMDEICDRNVILASTTSGLSPTDIALHTKNPERIVVAHFWNPPQLIPLVEIVPGEKTSSETMDIITKFIEKLGKVPVRMEKECLGFIGNRLQLALLREALYIVEKGWAKIEEVDKAVEYGFGRRLPITGPIKSADMGGLDIFYNISEYLFEDLCDSKEPSYLMKEKVEKNELGIKSKKGFYEWDDDIIERTKNRRNEVLKYFICRDREDQ